MKLSSYTVVISAGGKGTRIASVASDIPKPMIPVDGIPVLEHELISLKNQGFTRFIFTIGHLGHLIKEYFGNGGKWGISIDYFEEKDPLGTAGALYYLKDELQSDFLYLNGDAVMDIDFERMIRFHESHAGKITLFTHPNSHPYDSALIVADSATKQVTRWINKEDERTIYKNRVNAGVHILSPEVLAELKPGKSDLDRDLLKPMVPKGWIYAYDSTEYVKDMGTPDRLASVCRDIQAGRVHARNLSVPQKAVFLDRDGTINRYMGFLSDHTKMELLDGVGEAIRRINEAGYLAIVVTNQPVIARGECTFAELEMIHNAMETQLGREGAYVDDIFICPHHPDRGFPGERPEYKIECNCRKPKPGLILAAAEKYNIDLSQSYMVGDSDRDMEAGKAAGCTCVLIGENDAAGFKNRYGSLLDFVKDKERIGW